MAKKKTGNSRSGVKSGVDSAVDPELKKQARRVVRGLAKHYGDAECALLYRSPYELLVATILSAQCTDERVNKTTPALFEAYPDAAALAVATQPDVERLVKSTGFFRAKSKNIRGMAQRVVAEHGGEIPADFDALICLPGVGRKTASVVLGTIFGIAKGVVVDTHVKRISYLLGLTTSKNPVIAERELMALLPKKEWVDYSHRMIHHGRQVCIARRPQCAECAFLKFCKRVDLPPLS